MTALTLDTAQARITLRIYAPDEHMSMLCTGIRIGDGVSTLITLALQPRCGGILLANCDVVSGSA